MRIILILFAISFVSCGKKFEPATNANEYHHLKIEEAYIPIMVRGNIASGKILLYIQGGPGEHTIDFAESDYPQWKESLEKEYALAYYDQRGTGNAQGTFDSESISFEQYLEDLDQVARFLKEKYLDCEIYLMGHSFGGYLMMRYMLERGSESVVDKYINLNGPATSDADSMRWEFRRDWIMTIADERIAENNEAMYWDSVIDFFESHPVLDSTHEWAFWNRTVDAKIYPNYEDPPITTGDAFNVLFASPYNFFNTYLRIGNLDKVEERLFDEWKSFELIRKLDGITHPILIMTGRYDDRTPPEEAQFIFDSISSSEKKVVVLPEAGHYCYYHQKAMFMDEIRAFLE